MTPFLTTAETALRLGISERRVRQFAASGRLTSIRVGRAYLFRTSAVERFASLARGPGIRGKR